jgi:hypothetical protein
MILALGTHHRDRRAERSGDEDLIRCGPSNLLDVREPAGGKELLVDPLEGLDLERTRARHRLVRGVGKLSKRRLGHPARRLLEPDRDCGRIGAALRGGVAAQRGQVGDQRVAESAEHATPDQNEGHRSHRAAGRGEGADDPSE